MLQKPARVGLRRRVLLLLAVVGPGIIAANADNDASGIYGYSFAGAKFGYEMIPILLLSAIALAVAQEMGARMAAVTGKGLADLIREEYGVKITLFAMLALLVANFATTVSEFAGILVAVRIFSPDWVRFIILPLMAVVFWFLIVRGSYHRLERVLLGASAIYLCYIVSMYLARPHWGDVLAQTISPFGRRSGSVHDYLFCAISVVGTTITPWGQFYIQSSVRDKGLGVKNYRLLRADVFFGVLFANLIAFSIIVACGATLYAHGIHDLTDVGQAAKALTPFAGKLASALFALGLLNASCFGAITVPLSTAYSITEALGWESGVGRRIREAPLFVGVITVLLVSSALVVMLFPAHLAWLLNLPNIVGAALLPIILVLMLKMMNRRRLMGRYVNSRTYNFIAWTTTVVLVILSVILVVTSIFPV